MAKESRKYYRIRKWDRKHNTDIQTGCIEIHLDPWEYKGFSEDARLDFKHVFYINIQFMDNGAGYWFVTGYDLPSAKMYYHAARLAKIMEEVHRFVEGREDWAKDGGITTDQQLKLSDIGYVEIEYPMGFGYFYPKELAPVNYGVNHKWIMLALPGDFPTRKRPKPTHFITNAGPYNVQDVVYLGFVYAPSAEEAQDKIKKRLIDYDGKPEAYAAYMKSNTVPLPKFEIWPNMVQIDA